MLFLLALVAAVSAQKYYADDCNTFNAYECDVAPHCKRRSGSCEFIGCEKMVDGGSCSTVATQSYKGTTSQNLSDNKCIYGRKKEKGKQRCIDMSDLFTPSASYCSGFNSQRKKCGKKGCVYSKLHKVCYSTTDYDALACTDYFRRSECNQHSDRCDFHKLASPKCFAKSG